MCSSDLIGYIWVVDPVVFIRARAASRLSQAELAVLAGTSRTALSAYEHGRKSPTLDTADRILGCAGFDLVAVPRVVFRECSTRRGRPFYVADQWWTVPPERATTVPIARALSTLVAFRSMYTAFPPAARKGASTAAAAHTAPIVKPTAKFLDIDVSNRPYTQ